MIFVDPPPPSIGEVLYRWTNNGPNGPKPPPLAWKLLPIWMGAMAGFVLGLIGVFVVGGTLEHYHHRLDAAWFLYSLAGGTLAGILIGIPLSMRATKILTLFVGEKGSAQISRGKILLLDFTQVEDIRTHVSSMSYKGITTSAREYHVRWKDGKERLWYVEPVSPKPDDPQFAAETLRAFQNAKRV